MKTDEMKLLIKESKELQKKTEHDIRKRYADENNPYKLGDFINHKSGRGKILKITYSLYPYWSDDIQCLFIVENLTKSGSVNKREPEVQVYQNDIISQED